MSRGDHTIDVESIDGTIVVTPVGDIDLGRSPSVRAAIASANARRPNRLIVDLAAVPYMDSSGVATLVEALQIARRENSVLLLCGLQPRVRSVFEIARLDNVFTIHADRATALAAT